MGSNASRSLLYAVPLEGGRDTINPEVSSQVYRAASHPNELVIQPADITLKNSWDLFQNGVNIAGDGNCLGTREHQADGKFGEYIWKSYKQTREAALQFGAGLLTYDAIPSSHYPGEKPEYLRIMGLYSKNREEWIICEQAANAYGFTVVPLYDTLGATSTLFIMSQTCMQTVAASAECAEKLLEVEFPDLKFVVVFDEITDSLRQSAEKNNVTLFAFKDVIEKGKAEPKNTTPPSFDDINTICYTSGTTGDPKGVMLTHRNFVACAAGALEGPLSSGFLQITPDDIHLSYLPLAHVFERIVVNIILFRGSSIGFYQGDAPKVFEDLKVLRPTLFCAVPRIFNRIHEKIKSGVEEKSAVVQSLFKIALESKISKIHSSACTKHALWDPIVFNATRKLLGGRVRVMLTGSAPLDPLIHDKIKAFFGVPVLQGYGMTESMAASFLSSPDDALAGHVGGVFPCLEFKFESVPDMQYDATANPPCGELCMRGPTVSPGYFRNQEETDKTFKNGWLYSGDVATVLPNGAVKIIDRKKNIFKLAQGEYVVPEKLENVYVQAPIVSQAFVYGNPLSSSLVAIFVANKEDAKSWAKKHMKQGDSDNIKEIYASTEFKQYVLEQVKAVSQENGLKGFEIVSAIDFSEEEFTVQNDLLTPTFKLKRAVAGKKYKDQIDAMYATLPK